MGGSSHANEQTESFPEIGSFVMLFDLETDHWFKCKVTMETSNLVQLTYCGWNELSEKPWVAKDSESIESMEEIKGKWKCFNRKQGAWRRVTPSNIPAKIMKLREMERENQEDAD